MARKPSQAKQDQATDQQKVDPEKVEAPEASTQTAAEPKSETAAKTKSGMVEATLKTRHCRGGICKEAGDTMRMTQGEYARLKKYDRVE